MILKETRHLAGLFVFNNTFAMMLLFLNISGGEIVVIFLIILLLFGPESIPSIARGLGRAIRTVKDAAGDVQREIRDSANKIQQDAKSTNPLNIKEDLDIEKDLEDPLQ